MPTGNNCNHDATTETISAFVALVGRVDSVSPWSKRGTITLAGNCLRCGEPVSGEYDSDGQRYPQTPHRWLGRVLRRMRDTQSIALLAENVGLDVERIEQIERATGAPANDREIGALLRALLK